MAEDALEWVKGRNAAALSELGDPKATQDYARILSILDSKEKIPYVGRVLNGLYYNFWQDENHIRGIWRRTTLPEYRKTSPAWETVLDLDALGKEEGESWVWKGSVVLDEGPDVRTDRVMIKLSRGGADATEVNPNPNPDPDPDPDPNPSQNPHRTRALTRTRTGRTLPVPLPLGARVRHRQEALHPRGGGRLPPARGQERPG